MIRIKQFRTSYKELDRLAVEDKDSHKVCVFLSVLMASLFITNSGDVISELVGGGLQQSAISVALKVFCAISFLYCIPAIVRRFTNVKLVIIFASALVILVNILFFSSSQFTDTIVTYTTMCLTGFLAVDSLRDFSLLKLYYIKTSRIIAVLGILVLLLSFTGIISSLRTGGYRMGLGYACITCVMMLLWSFVEKKRVLDLIGAIGLLALIFLYGSRGPLVGIMLFALYFGIRYFHRKGQDIVCVLIFIAMDVFVISFRDMMDLINKMLVEVGINSRSIYLLANQSLSYDSGRGDIWDVIIAEIEKNPFRIRGINAEYSITGTYAHNMVIELVYQFGIVIGGIILLYLLAKIIQTLKLDVKADASVICLIFMFACIPSLMFSGSLWIAQNFWIWLALIVRFKHERRKEVDSSDNRIVSSP